MGSIVSRAAVKDDATRCSVAAHVPEDLVKSEILTRLPVMSIVRFRCVCKSWKSLLSGQDPDFVQSHLTRNSTDSLIARCFPYINPNNIHPLNSRFVEFGGSVNGLVCVYSHNYFEGYIQSVGLWNPAINHYKDIPLPPCSTSFPDSIYGGMECFCFGIGFDPIANDYKVMYITTIYDGPLVAHVYSCNSDSWGIKPVMSTFVVPQRLHFKCPTVVHGRPYWYTVDNNCPQRFNVMFFHVQDEVFRLLPALDVCYHNHRHTPSRVLVNFRDSLAFMFSDSVPRTTSRSVDVYVFDEKCHLWTKNYRIGPITIPNYMGLLHCFRNGDLFFTCGKYVKVVAFNPQTHAVNRFASGMYLYDCPNLVSAYGCGYTESLVSVKGMSLLHVPKAATDILVIEKCF